MKAEDTAKSQNDKNVFMHTPEFKVYHEAEFSEVQPQTGLIVTGLKIHCKINRFISALLV